MLCSFMVPGILLNWPSTKLGFCPRAKPTLKQHMERLANTQLEFTILHHNDSLQQINTCLTMDSRP